MYMSTVQYIIVPKHDNYVYAQLQRALALAGACGPAVCGPACCHCVQQNMNDHISRGPDSPILWVSYYAHIILQGYKYTYMHALLHGKQLYVLWVTTTYVRTYIPTFRVPIVKYNHTDQPKGSVYTACVYRIGACLFLGQVTCDFLVNNDESS